MTDRNIERLAKHGRRGSARLTLLDGFDFACDGVTISVAPSAQRLIAFLALQGRPVARVEAAGVFWPDTTEEQATANLRSLLWRIGEHRSCVVEAIGRTYLRISSDASVDYSRVLRHARRLLEGDGDPAADEGLFRELLPEWQDDWVETERERYRQLRLHALDSCCRGLVDAGRFAEAVQVGMAIVANEPLRDTANEILIAAHLAEGNQAKALRQYERYSRLLDETLGLAPSPRVTQLVRARLVS